MEKNKNILNLGAVKHPALTNIYMLVDPREPEVAKYIGKADCLKERLKNHISAALNKNDRKHGDNYHKDSWIRGLFARGLKPQIVLIAIVKKSVWQEFENHYIKLFRSFGAKLLNVQEGGQGGSMPESIRLTMGSKGEKNGNYGGKSVTEYQREVARDTMKEYCHNSQGFLEYVKSLRGKPSWNSGIKLSDAKYKVGGRKNKGLITITDGVINRKIQKEESIPVGFIRGFLTKRTKSKIEKLLQNGARPGNVSTPRNY